MRFAADVDRNRVLDSLSTEPPGHATCILCGAPVVLRGGALGLLFSLLVERRSPHYAHIRRGTCEYSPDADGRVRQYLERACLEDPILC